MNLCKTCPKAEYCKEKCPAQKKADDDYYWYIRAESEHGIERRRRRYQRWRENIGNGDNDDNDPRSRRTKWKEPKFKHKDSEDNNL